MHRLLTSGGKSIRKLSPSPSASFELRTCCITTRFFNVCQLCLRNQSTNSNTHPSVAKHKTRTRQKNKKSFSDVLVVTDKKMQQKKTNITKLTWDDLRLLATTNLNLNELYKLKAPPVNVNQHTYNNLQLDPVPIISSSANIVTKTPAITELDQEQLQLDEQDLMDEAQSPLQPAVADEMVETSQVESRQINIDARNALAMKTLASYMELCSDMKNPQRGLNAVIFHNFRASRGKFSPVKSRRVYNALLKGFGDKGDIAKLEEVLQMMRNDNVKPNIQTYVTILEAYARADSKTNDKNYYLKMIRIHTKDALNNGISFDEMMNYGIFVNDGRDLVLSSIRKYDPGYKPTYYRPYLQYDNHLVDRLNDLCVNSNMNKSTNGLFKPEVLKEAAKIQLDQEKTGVVVVKNIANRGKPTPEVVRYRETLSSLYSEWQSTAQKAFIRDLSALSAQRSPLNYEPYMRCLPLGDYVKIIIEEGKKVAEGSETYSPTVSQLHRDLGIKVYNRYKVLKKQKTGVLDKVMSVHNAYCESYANIHGELHVLPDKEVRINPRQMWQLAEHAQLPDGATIKNNHQEWSPAILQTIGKFLYRIVMHDLRVDVNSLKPKSKHRNLLPAFYTIFRTQGFVVKEEVKPHPILSRLYRLSQPETLSFSVAEVPMLCPPLPWTTQDSGGYLVANAEMVRLPVNCVVQRRRIRKTQSKQLYPSLDALNQLGAMPWMVNKPILNIILEVFNNGGSSKLDVPEPPSIVSAVPSAATGDMDKDEKFKLFRQKLQRRRKQAEMYSLWCDCLYRLSLANHYKDDVFWLPHNMDFRGRVYPIPPHLNHLGSDLARSMLIFAEGRPLGDKGLDWLKIHLINLTGLKKRNTIKERLEYADECLDDILDSAERPLDGRRWWAESDEPWQSLACCMEIANVLKSPDIRNYKCHFPVHQDGSCNGLQHYAALGRDQAGAYSVNLSKSEIPQDVYSAVVSLVEEQRRRDALEGSDVAKCLEGFVRRKVIKQTIMTTVYGVTRFGARLQIAKQLKDFDDFPKDLVWGASQYLTAKTFDSLRTMFTSTREIQDWFTDCARLISSVSGKYVEWVTPMGLPVVQPYYRETLKPKTGGMYKSFHTDEYDKPNVLKQRNAFPPNFIHSLDSSHMMLTSLFCERAGITFVSVHDCYWTHPSTVDIMNKICREQFVALHSQPILEDLSAFFADKYTYDEADIRNDGSVTDITKRKLNKVLTQVPRKGNFDLNEVLESEYFFS